MSIDEQIIDRHETKQIRLHWGLRDESHLFWFDNFERLMGIYPNFVFDPVLSQPSQDWSLCSGHVQDCLLRDFPSAGSGLKGWQGYVCGNPTMVEQVSAKLVELGMKAELVHHEKFV
jgi:NAD(P)H-flavin reductase